MDWLGELALVASEDRSQPRKIELCIWNNRKHFTRHRLDTTTRKYHMFAERRCTPTWGRLNWRKKKKASTTWGDSQKVEGRIEDTINMVTEPSHSTYQWCSYKTILAYDAAQCVSNFRGHDILTEDNITIVARILIEHDVKAFL
jgi:hypothetical protein